MVSCSGKYSASGAVAARALLLRNDRQQHMCRAVGTGVQGHIAAEDCRRTIARIVVGEGTDASPYLSQRLQAGAGLAWKYVVGAAHGECQAVALRQHNA